MNAILHIVAHKLIYNRSTFGILVDSLLVLHLVELCLALLVCALEYSGNDLENHD